MTSTRFWRTEILLQVWVEATHHSRTDSVRLCHQQNHYHVARGRNHRDPDLGSKLITRRDSTYLTRRRAPVWETFLEEHTEVLPITRGEFSILITACQAGCSPLGSPHLTST